MGHIFEDLEHMSMYLTQPIRHGRYCPHIVPPLRQPPRYRVLYLRNYHIRDRRGSRLVGDVQVARIGGFNLMILMENMITYKSYCQHNMGYDVVWLEAHTTADDDAQGIAGMIVRNRPHGWSTKKMSFHMPTMMICKVVDGKCIPLIGAYPPPSTLEDLPGLE